jgi:hypothetical protein
MNYNNITNVKKLQERKTDQKVIYSFDEIKEISCNHAVRNENTYIKNTKLP